MKLEGFDEFISMVEGMAIEDYEVNNALKKALKAPKEAAENNSPDTTGETKKSIRVKMKKEAFGTTGIIYVSNWKAMFQEFRNSKQKGKYVGWFERSITSTEGEVIKVMKAQLLDKKVK